MASARGDALDWAVALARAPGERHALRKRPLPDGMEALLQLAGGTHGPALAEAAAHTGLTQAELVEAARFYSREVLFFREADAYRVLGLSADASDEQIKHHHRLLQQWLHPDRLSSDWDAAFAARVNAAWSQLRTPARREALAARLPALASSPAPGGLAWGQPIRIPAVSMAAGGLDSGIDQDRWRRRGPVLALFGVCAMLGVLAVRDMQRVPDRGSASGERAAGAASDEATLVALQLPGIKAPPAKPPAPERIAASPAASPAQRFGKRAPAPEARPAGVAVASKPIQNPTPAPSATRPVATQSEPMTTALAQVPARKPAAAVASSTLGVKTLAAPVTVATKPSPPSAVAGDIPPPVKPAVTATSKTPVAPAIALAKLTAAPHARAATAAEPPSAQKPAVTPAPVAVASPPPVAAPAANSPAQVAQAQQIGQRLLAYVAGRGGGMPPIWANYAAQTQASRAREALQGNGRVVVSQPDWRVGGNSAAMQASLTRGSGDDRRLRVDLVWREQRWLVESLALEQAR